MSEGIDHLLVFAAALATVVVLTPPSRWLARRLGAVDAPGERRVHRRPTPRLGGLAIFAGVVVGVAVAWQLPAFADVFDTTREPQAVLAASLIVVVLGLVDDLRGVPPVAKLAGQVLAGGVLVLFGVNLLFVYIPGNPGSVVSLGSDLGALLTILAIVAMINAVNLVDGLDGLAAGVVAIAAAALFCYVQFAEATTVGLASASSLLLAAVIGAAVGFLFFNSHPASVFMGDTGAMLLGFLLAAAGVSAIGGTIQPSRGAFAALSVPVLVPALVLAVPIVDTIWTIVRRLSAGQRVFSPDKRHLHHRLVAIGHSQRRAVLIMYYWSALLAFAAVGVSLLPSAVVIAVLVAGVLAAAVVAVLGRLRRGLARRRERTARARWLVSSFTRTGDGDP